MVFILTNSDDATADYLCSRLTKERIDFFRFDTDKALEETCIHYRNNIPILVAQREIPASEIKSLWYRRPLPLTVSVGKDSSEKFHSAREWSEALEGFLAHVDTSKWINHPAFNAMASHKVEQLSRASQFGMGIPSTLVTQKRDDFMDFWEECSGQVIVKPMALGFLERENPEDDTHIFTSQVTKEHLNRLDSLELCPTLFQKMVVEKQDVRVTVIDGTISAVALTTKEGHAPVLDIRRDNMANVSYQTIPIPDQIQQAVSKYIGSYGLRFGALDFAIDPNGNWIFFELNPNGQWAWLDLVGATDIGSHFIETFRRTSFAS